MEKSGTSLPYDALSKFVQKTPNRQFRRPIMIRVMAIAASLLVAFVCSKVEADQSKAPSMEDLDGICKVDKIPIGYVAVGEYNSAQCTSANPVERSAWYVDKVRDGIVSCAVPDYANGYPPVISYLVCRQKVSASCPGHLDGGPNAYELTIPSNCNGAGVGRFCNWRYRCGRYPCGNANYWIAASFDDPICENDPIHLESDGKTLPACDHWDSDCKWVAPKGSPGANTRTVYIRSPASGCDEGDALINPAVWPCRHAGNHDVPSCVADNAPRIKQFQERNIYDIRWYAKERNDKAVKTSSSFVRWLESKDRNIEVVIRRFYADYCPPVPSGPNALISRVVGVDADVSDLKTICDVSLPPQQLSDGSWNKDLKLKRLHDDRCGQESGLNALSIVESD